MIVLRKILLIFEIFQNVPKKSFKHKILTNFYFFCDFSLLTYRGTSGGIDEKSQLKYTKSLKKYFDDPSTVIFVIFGKNYSYIPRPLPPKIIVIIIKTMYSKFMSILNY